ncbi:MAG: FAD:protein FMN transferase [Anaerolineales bacterium]|jgi:thiamine biosynthesis lipoprotein
MDKTDVPQHKLTRRDFIKITALAGGVLVGGGLLDLSREPKSMIVRDTRMLMGTVIDITLVAESDEAGQTALHTAFSEMERLTHIFNYRETDSQLGQLNQNGKLDQAAVELIGMLEQAKHFSEISNGAFDITVLPALEALQNGHPITQAHLDLIDYRNVEIQAQQIKFRIPGMRITLDGIAKGRVVDGGVAALKNLGYENILVEAGGDLLANGAHPDGNLWKIGVVNPRPTTGSQWLTAFRVNDRAVATSGDYMHTFTSDYRLNHIIDPRTGLSPAELSSTTVIASSVAQADALATTLMVLGVADGMSLVRRLPGVEALVATKDLRIYRSAGFPAA